MADLLLISNVLLWGGILVLVGLVVVLARQVGALQDRIAPAGALMVNQRLTAGDPAPLVPATTLTGTALTVGEPTAGRSQLIFFLAPDCPICCSLLPVLHSVAEAEPDVDVVLASDGGELADHQSLVRERGLERYPYVVSQELGLRYGVGKLPYAVLVDDSGFVAALGIVNSREHLESLFEARERQVGSLQQYLARAAAPAHAINPTHGNSE